MVDLCNFILIFVLSLHLYMKVVLFIWFKDMARLHSHLDLAFQFGMVILELSSMLLMQRTFITYSNQGNHPTSGLLFFNQALG